MSGIHGIPGTHGPNGKDGLKGAKGDEGELKLDMKLVLYVLFTCLSSHWHNFSFSTLCFSNIEVTKLFKLPECSFKTPVKETTGET